jgi:TetR/AcrR family tetracycline transcriptional repressor
MPGSEGTRRRGRPPRIDRARIVAVARTMDPETLTMRAVAERLGVDRKALNYHVTDRDGLLALVAHDRLNAAAVPLDLPEGADWRQVVRACAVAMRESLVGTGALFDYVRLSPGGAALFAPVERAVQALLDAGFDDRRAGAAMAFLGEFVYASARDAVLTQRYGVHPQLAEMRRMLAEAPPGTLGGLRRMTARPLTGEEQFAFDLDVFIAGLERRPAG